MASYELSPILYRYDRFKKNPGGTEKLSNAPLGNWDDTHIIIERGYFSRTRNKVIRSPYI